MFFLTYQILVLIFRPTRNHFYPTLQQFKYEIEDGRTPEGSRIRYGFDDTFFPNFSWRGYAILTAIQVFVIKGCLMCEIYKEHIFMTYDNFM